MTGKRLARRILAVGLMAAVFGVAEAQQVLEVDSTEIPPVANQAAVDATPCGFGRDLNENQTLINLELFSVHWCNAITGTWEGAGTVAGIVAGTPFDENGVAIVDASGELVTDPAFVFNLTNGDLTLDCGAGDCTLTYIQGALGAVDQVDFGDFVIDAAGNATLSLSLEVGQATPTFPALLTNSSIATGGGADGRILIEGSDSAGLTLNDSGGPVDGKIMELITEAGVTRFQTITDAGNIGIDQALVVKHSDGFVGLGTQSPVRDLHIRKNSSGKVYSTVQNVGSGEAVLELIAGTAADATIELWDNVAMRAEIVVNSNDEMRFLGATKYVFDDDVNLNGCTFFGPLSTAPSGVACDRYYDTDINKLCIHNGTSFRESDDYTTACI